MIKIERSVDYLCRNFLIFATLRNSKRASFIQDRFDFRRAAHPDTDMALLPRDTFRTWWDDMDRFHRDVEERFHSLSLRDDPWWRMPPVPSFRDVFRPWRRLHEDLDRQIGATTIEHDNDRYHMVVDVRQFAPEEITVRTDDKYITVEGKHHEKKDRHGFVSREFVRRYLLPKGYDIGHVKPSLSSDGILTITAPKLALPAPGERIVPIRRSYFPAIKAS